MNQKSDNAEQKKFEKKLADLSKTGVFSGRLFVNKKGELLRHGIILSSFDAIKEKIVQFFSIFSKDLSKKVTVQNEKLRDLTIKFLDTGRLNGWVRTTNRDQVQRLIGKIKIISEKTHLNITSIETLENTINDIFNQVVTNTDSIPKDKEPSPLSSKNIVQVENQESPLNSVFQKNVSDSCDEELLEGKGAREPSSDEELLEENALEPHELISSLPPTKTTDSLVPLTSVFKQNLLYSSDEEVLEGKSPLEPPIELISSILPIKTPDILNGKEDVIVSLEEIPIDPKPSELDSYKIDYVDLEVFDHQITPSLFNKISSKSFSSPESPPPIFELPLWLKTGKNAPPVSDKLLVHVVGDEFAKAAQLEGENPLNMLLFALNCLKEKPDFLPESSWESTQKLLNGTVENHLKFSMCNNLGDLVDKVDVLKQQIIDCKKDGEPLLLSGGWKTQDGGHCLYYMIMPQENGQFTFRLFNRGAGLQYHSSSVEHGSSVFYPAYKEIEGIEEQDLLNPVFLQAMLEFQTFSRQPENDSIQTKYNEKDIYEEWIGLLKGKEKPIALEFEELMSPQVSGTCAWKSLTAVLQMILGKTVNRQMKCRFEMQALWSYYEANQNNLGEPKNRNLIVQSVSNLAFSLKALYKNKEIEEEEYIQQISLLSHLQKQVEMAEQKFLMEISSKTDPLPSTESDFKISTQEKAKTPSSFLEVSDLALEFKENISSSIVPAPLTDKVEQIKLWKPSAKLIVQDLTHWLQECKEANLQKNYATTHFLFVELTKLLPVPTQESPFWKEVAEHQHSDCSQVLELVCDLFQEFYTSHFYLPVSSQVEERVYASTKIAHLQNILASSTPFKEFGFFHLSLDLFSLKEEEDNRSLFFSLENPQFALEMSEIGKDYKKRLESKKSGEIFVKNGQVDLGASAHSFILNLLKDYSFSEKIVELYDTCKNKIFKNVYKNFNYISENSKIAFVYAYGKETLPPTFVKWNQSAIEISFLTAWRFIDKYHYKKNERLKEIIPSLSIPELFTDDKKVIPINVRVNIFDIYSSAKSFSYLYKDRQRPFSEQSNFEFIVKGWERGFLSYGDKESEGIENDLYNGKSINANELKKRLPQSAIKEIFILGSYPELQIEKSLAYFTKNIALLKEQDWQTLFHMLLFEKNLLLKEFETNPNIVSSIKNLLNYGFERAVNTSDISTSVFFLHLSRRFEAFYLSVCLEGTQENFLSYDQEMENLLKDPNLSEKDKSLIYSERIASYADLSSLDEKQVLIMTQGLIHLSFYPIPTEVSFSSVVDEREKAVIKHIFSIQKHLSEKKNAILNRALGPYMEDFKDQEWESTTFPLFTTKDGWILNALTGDFFVKNLKKTALPYSITESPLYQSLFKKPYLAQKIQLNLFEFSDEHENTYRIFLVKNDLHIQRKIGETWYALKENPEKEFSKEIPQGFLKPLRVWISIESPKKIACLDPSDRTYPIQLTTPEVITPEKNEFDLVISRYQDRSVKESLTLKPKTQNNEFDFLTRFEHPNHLFQWIDDKGIPRRIDLNRFNLNFQLDDSNPKQLRWRCLQKKGFYLAPNQKVSVMGNLQNYLILQNDRGEKQILIPSVEINPEQKSDFVFSETLSLKSSLESDSIGYETYLLNEKRQIGKEFFKPATPAASLHLAYLKLAAGRYGEARYFMDLSKMPLKGDFGKELEILKKILSLKIVNKDSIVQACALRMQAACLYQVLLERHSSSLKGEDKNVILSKEEWNSLTEDCNTYISQIKRVGRFRLSVDQEKMILKGIKGHNPSSVTYAMKWYMQIIGLDFSDLPILKKDQVREISSNKQKICNGIQKGFYFTLSGKEELFSNSAFIGNLADCWRDLHKDLLSLEIPDKRVICCTRPTKANLRLLLVAWIKQPTEELKDHIQSCLSVSKEHIDDTIPSDSTVSSRMAVGQYYALIALLEKLVNDSSCIINLPEPEKLKSKNSESKKDSSQEIFDWYRTSNIPQLLQHYIKENKNDKPFKSPVLSPQIIGTIPGEKSKVSRPPSSYVEKVPETLSNSYTNSVKSFSSLKLIPPAIHRVSEEELKNMQQIEKKNLEKASQCLFSLLETDKVKGRCLKNELERIKKDCENYCSNTTKQIDSPNRYTLNLTSLQDLKENLEQQISYSHQQLIEKKENLLSRIHPSSIEDIDTTLSAIPFLKNKREKIGLERVIILYGRQQLDELCHPPSFLKKRELPELKLQIEEYLVFATKIQQAERALNKTEICLSQFQEKQMVDPEDMQFLMDQLLAKRQFNVISHPQFLVLEYWSHLLLRRDQLEKIETYMKKGDIQPVLQIIMGAGKTAVLAPLIGLLFADGNHLSAVMMPESLAASALEELREKLGRQFDQTVYPFDFKRDSDYSSSRLQDVKERLLQIIENREVLVTTPQSIHAFYLKTLEIWRSLSKVSKSERKELKQQFALMRNILNIFGTKTKLLMDEIDTILRSRLEVNFPIGKSNVMPERDMDFLFELYDCFSSEKMQKLISCEFNKNNQFPNAPPFTEEHYHKTVKPALAEELLEKMKKNEFGNKEITEKIHNFFNREGDQRLILAYLNGNKELLDQADDYVVTIKDKDITNLLVLAKEELNILLPLSLKRNCEEDFGVDTSLFAVPFHLGKPSVNTEFSDPYEAANYTLQAYLYRGGIPEELVKPHLQNLEQQALHETDPNTTSSPVSLEETQAFADFKALCGGKKIFNLFKLSKEEIGEICREINKNQNQKKFFFRKFILPAISFQSKKLNSNSQTLVALFFKVFGFSGTSTWNASTYHDKLTTFAEEGTDAKTLIALLGSGGFEGPALEISFSSPQEFLSQLPLRGNSLALIDNGSYLRGEGLETLARHLLVEFENKKRPIKGIVFYDENDKQMVLEAGSSKQIPLSESALSPEERFTLYPKAMTTGAHVEQASTAEGYMTVSANLLLRDLLQSVLRMRKLGKGQKIQFIVSREDQQIINAKLKRGLLEKIMPEDILLLSMINQANQIGDDNHLSLKQKMLDAIQEEVRRLLLDPNGDIDQLAQLYTEAMEEVFVPDTGSSPLDLYGGRERKEKAEEILKRETDHYIDLSKKALPKDSQEVAEKKIRSFENKIDLLHEEIVSRKQESTEVEGEKHINKEIEGHKNIQVEVSQLNEGKYNITKKFDVWPKHPDSMYSYDYYRIPNIPSKVDENSPKLFSVHEFLIQEKTSPKIANALFPQLLVSVNLMDLYESPFKTRQKIMQYALVLHDNKTAKPQILLLDHREAVHFRTELQNTFEKKNVESRELSLHLIDLKLNKGIQSGNKNEEVLENEEVKELLTQARFVAGEPLFKEEWSRIKKWCEREKIELRELEAFYKVAVRYHPNSEQALKSFQLTFN